VAPPKGPGSRRPCAKRPSPPRTARQPVGLVSWLEISGIVLRLMLCTAQLTAVAPYCCAGRVLCACRGARSISTSPQVANSVWKHAGCAPAYTYCRSGCHAATPGNRTGAPLGSTKLTECLWAFFCWMQVWVLCLKNAGSWPAAVRESPAADGGQASWRAAGGF
jgi:hypothetical protein